MKILYKANMVSMKIVLFDWEGVRGIFEYVLDKKKTHYDSYQCKIRFYF